MIIVELIYNLSLLVSLSVLSGFIDARFKRKKTSGIILQGTLFGITAVIGMLYPFVLTEGIIFDGRTIVISLCTLFFGPISGAIAAVISAGFRFYLGGGGVLMGILTISTAFILGLLFHNIKIKSANKSVSNLKLYLLGLLVHGVMLALIFSLPPDNILETYKTIGFTVIGVYPIMTLIIGKILHDQERTGQLINDLTKSENKFRALAETSPSSIFIYQGNKFVYVNKSSKELTGYDSSELIGKEFWSIVHPDHKELIKNRGLSRQKGGEVPGRYQFKILRKTGELRWLDFAATTIELDGKPAALATAYDITSMIESLETLQQQKELFQTTIYSIGDGVITTNIAGEIQQLNPVAEQLTGYKESEVKGISITSVFKIINEYTREIVDNPVQKVLQQGHIVGLANHTLLISKDKTEIPIADSGAPIKTKDGKIIGVVLVFRNQSEERSAEAKLKESEEKFRTLVEHAFDGIYMMDDKKYTYVNERFCELTGYSKNELTSDLFDFNKLLTEQSKEVVEQRYLSRKRGEVIPITYAMQILTKEGGIKEVELSTASIGNMDHIGVIGIMRDITERKKAEEELKQAKERMQVLVEGTPHLFFYVQDINADIQYISPSVEKITGYKIEEWLGQGHWFVTDSPINETARKRTRANLSGEINTDSILVEIKHAHGSNLLLEVYEKPILENSKVVGLQGVAHDVTNQKIAEDKLKEINYRLQTAIDGANIGIWDQDFNENKISRLGRWGEMLGYSTNQIKDDLLAWRELIHPDDLLNVERITKEHKKGLVDNFKVEHRLLTSSGDYKWVLNWGRIYERDENGKPLKASGIHLDIDDRKKAELAIEEAKVKAERANQLKSEFLAQISHEIRSPLNAVLNFSQLLKEEFTDKMSENIAVSFDGIESASKRVIRTIDLILNMSELQLGTYEVTRRSLDLVVILSNIRLEYLNLARSKNLELKLINNFDTAEILSDEYAINQIFANLVDNAIKYTLEGFVHISLSKADNGYLVAVSDSGVGISKDFIPEIFEAFSQEEQGYSRKFEGSGLGMSLVKKYCELINAEIKIESERGKGTTFKIVL